MAVRREATEGAPASATARILAVVALALAAVVVLIVVAGSLGGDSGTSEDDGAVPTETSRRPAQEYYVITQGDTFDAIAAKVGVPTRELERLNPDLDTQQLPIAQCINLVPDGCQAAAQGQ